MTSRSIVLLGLAATTLASCATSRTSSLPPHVVAKVTADAAAQVKRCYRAPKVLGEARRISTRLRVRYASDGNIIGLPAVLSQSGVTPGNQLFADEMAEAAIASVVRCSPLRLPPELHQLGWNEFVLTFSPSLRG